MPSWKKVVLHGQDATLGDLTLTNLTSSAVLGTDADGNVIAGTVTGTPIATTSTVGTVKIGDGLNIDANGELTLGSVGLTDINGGTTAGFLKTNNSGSISVDSTAYLPTSSANTLTLVSTKQPAQGTTVPMFNVIASGATLFSVDSAGYINAYSGFKTGGNTGFLKSDGTVDTTTYATSTDINSFIEIGDVGTYLSTNNYITSAAVGTVGATNYPTGSGTTKYLRQDGTFQVPPDTKYNNFTGASADANGSAGLVPMPRTDDFSNGRFLAASGNWVTPSYIANTDTNYYLSGASFATGSGVLTLTVSGATNQTVDLDGRYQLAGNYLTSIPSHDHDDRYVRADGGANDFRFELNLSGGIGTRYYKVATVNTGSGGLHIRGLISNHVESFGSQKIDLAIQGREGNSGDAIEINGTVSVFHQGCGILVVPGEKPGGYRHYDVYVVSTNYTQCELDLTIVGGSFSTEGSYLPDTPTGTAELDTTALTEGHYIVTDSTATKLGSAAFADTSAFDPAGAADTVSGRITTLEGSLGTAAAAATTDFAAASHTHTLSEITDAGTAAAAATTDFAAASHNHDTTYANIDHKYHRFNNGDQFYDGYGQNNYLRMFTETATFDTFRFRSYSDVQVYNGAEWVSSTMSLDNVLDGREDTGISLTRENSHFRFTINRASGWPTTALFILQSSWTNTNNYTCSVTLETLNGVEWEQKDTWTYSSFQRGINLYTTSQTHDGRATMRVTININWTDVTHNYHALRRIMFLSNFSGGETLDPWSWNYSKVVNFDALPQAGGVNLATQTWVGDQGYSTFDGAYSSLTDPPTLGTAASAATTDFAAASHTHDQYATTASLGTAAYAATTDFAAASHTHSEYASSTHNHDGRYYTETEIDTLLATKAASSHTHSNYVSTTFQTFNVAGDGNRFYKVSFDVSQLDEIEIFRNYSDSIGGEPHPGWNNSSETHFGGLSITGKVQENAWGGMREFEDVHVTHNYTIVCARIDMGDAAEYGKLNVWLRGGPNVQYKFRRKGGHTTTITVDYDSNVLTEADTAFADPYLNKMFFQNTDVSVGSSLYIGNTLNFFKEYS